MNVLGSKGVPLVSGGDHGIHASNCRKQKHELGEDRIPGGGLSSSIHSAPVPPQWCFFVLSQNTAPIVEFMEYLTRLHSSLLRQTDQIDHSDDLVGIIVQGRRFEEVI